MAKIDNTERLRKLYDDNDKALDTIRTTFKKDEVKGLEQYVAKLTDATEKLEQAEKSYDRCDSLIKKQKFFLLKKLNNITKYSKTQYMIIFSNIWYNI